MATKPKLKAGCGLLCVFAAGFLCGVIAFFVFLAWIIPLSEGWRDAESKRFVTNRIADELELTEEQRQELRPIIHESLDERYRRRKAYHEADIEIVEKGLERLDPLLTEPQRERAQRMFERWKRRKKRFLLPKEKEE